MDAKGVTTFISPEILHIGKSWQNYVKLTTKRLSEKTASVCKIQRKLLDGMTAVSNIRRTSCPPVAKEIAAAPLCQRKYSNG